MIYFSSPLRHNGVVMKMRNILHLVTFALTFSLSISVALVIKSFQGVTTPEKITNVLKEDINNGLSRHSNPGRGNVYLAVRTDDYVSASESINTDGLPADFQAAWQSHMQAWRTHADYLKEKRFSRGFEADYDAVSSDQINEINRTWYEVLRIARKHGAIIPANAYY